MPIQTERPLRVGFVSCWDVNDDSAMSGMPASAWKALSKQNLDLVHLNSLLLSQAETLPASPSLNLTRFLKGWAKAIMHPIVRNLFKKLVTGFKSSPNSTFDAQNFIEKAALQGQHLTELIQQDQFDLLFGVCISTYLYSLETTIPIIYASDATANLINSTYPEYQQKCQDYHNACNQIERQSLRGCLKSVLMEYWQD